MFVVYLLFFCSGFAALVYELLWFRQLGFIFGNTVYAATAVLTAYMLGLALGARIMAARAPQLPRPIRFFAALELGVGLYALMVPFLFAAIRLVYKAAFQHITQNMAVLDVLRFTLALAVLVIPTMMMGGTLPVLTQALVRNDGRFGRRLSALYGLNTIGAMTGVVACGFILIPWLGITRSTWLAATVNVLVALTSMIIGRGHVCAVPLRAGENQSARAVSAPALALTLSALSGFVALAMEVVWFRALTLVFGSTTYSFTAMLAVFLFGIGLGSVALGWLSDRTRYAGGLYAMLQVGIGVASLMAMYTYQNQPEYLLNNLIARGFDWKVMVGLQVVITLKCLLIPTLFMGFSFPLLVTWFRQQFGESSQAVGRIYAANTIGCVFGSLAGGFMLLPHLGIQHSLVLLAAVSLAAGMIALLAPSSQSAWRVAVSAFALIAGLWISFAPPIWDVKLLSAGPYFSPWLYVRNGHNTLREKLASQELLYYHEGVTATASVAQDEDMTMFFSMDGKVEADTSPRGMVVQRMIGHLPMLFHPNPRKVMNLGLGAGVTFGSLSCYPVDHLEVVEIEPAVTNVARIWNAHNHAVIERSDAIVTINDGRNHLFTTTNKYDVITSDPFEPVVGGAAHLFTVQHFQQARDRLEDGGIMCQWVPMYEMSRRDFLTIIRSFAHVYPQSALFFTGVDIVMLGFADEMHLDPADVRRKFQMTGVRASLAEIGFSQPEMILGMFVSDMGRARDFVGEGPLNTDNNPVIEFSAPKSAVQYTVESNQQVLARNFTDLPAFILEGLDEERGLRARREHDALRLALNANIARADARDAEAFELLSEAFRIAPDNPVIRNELISMILPSAEALRAQGERKDALHQYLSILDLSDRNFSALYNTVNLAMSLGQQQIAIQWLKRSASLYPRSGLIRAQTGKLLALQGRGFEALEEMRRAVRLSPRSPSVWDDYSSVSRMCNANEESSRAAAMAARLRAEQSRPSE